MAACADCLLFHAHFSSSLQAFHLVESCGKRGKAFLLRVGGVCVSGCGFGVVAGAHFTSGCMRRSSCKDCNSPLKSFPQGVIGDEDTSLQIRELIDCAQESLLSLC